MAAGPFAKYVAIRAITVFLVIVIALYLAILVANMGGYVDEIIKTNLAMEIALKYRGPQWQGYDRAEIERLVREEFELEVKLRGLDQPFLIRSVMHLRSVLTLDLGRSEYLTSDTGSRFVKNIILERLPVTVMLFTTATVLNFFIGMFIGLYLSRHHGGKLDKLFVGLTPTSVIPGWFYGIFLILIFASQLHILPYGGLVDAPPPTDQASYFLSMLKHMILPLASWIIAAFFLGGYSNRTFFLIFSTEDYVEAARAKGVPPRQIETRYILRPSLPSIVTTLALTLVNSWGGAIITERVFNWPGLGTTFYTAINLFDSGVVIGVTVIYAYLLGATVLILDILYGLIDPRIRVGQGG